MVRFCRKCGSKLDEKTGLCPKCGVNSIGGKMNSKKKRMFLIPTTVFALIIGASLVLSHFNVVKLSFFDTLLSKVEPSSSNNLKKYITSFASDYIAVSE